MRRTAAPTTLPAKARAPGPTFPHPFDGGPKKLKSVYYKQLYNSPFGNEMLLELAKRAIDGENLGHHDVPDLLCLSFSCNDPIGHVWGPDSQEVLDVTLRTDQIIKELLDTLDAKVGQGQYILVLTADHGVCPLPEAATARGNDAGRPPKLCSSRKRISFLWRSSAAMSGHAISRISFIRGSRSTRNCSDQRS